MVHKINNYDLTERSSAFWEGYKVEFTTAEFECMQGVDDMVVIEQTPNGVVVKYEPTKSDWEDLFK